MRATLAVQARLHRHRQFLASIAWILLGIAAAGVFGYEVGSGRGGLGSTRPAVALLAGGVAVAVWLRPFLGLVLFAVAVSVTEALPALPVSSAAAALGGLTFVSYLLQRRTAEGSAGKFAWAYAAAVGFIFWFTASNPAAALSSNSRNWVATYLQLLALLWLVSRMLDSIKAHQALMWAFGVGTAISSVVALVQVSVGQSFRDSERGAGLIGSNASARYALVALVFCVYLYGAVRTQRERLMVAALAITVVGGALATLSRTGLILLGCTVALVALVKIHPGTWRRVALVLVVVAAGVLLVPEGSVQVTASTIANAENQDSWALRLKLWRTGLAMAEEYPFQGVGIGEFPLRTAEFVPEGVAVPPGLAAHSIYVSLLAETGLVGLVLFLALIVACVRSAVRAARLGDDHIRSLARTWIVALAILLVGGITKHDQYDKLFWIACAGCLSFAYWRSLSVRGAD